MQPIDHQSDTPQRPFAGSEPPRIVADESVHASADTAHTVSSVAENALSHQELSVGDIVASRYKILAHIASGGYGSVYKVEQLLLKKVLALKTLNASTSSETVVRRFQIEAKAAANLEHPNLVRATDFGLIDGEKPFLVMEFYEGQTLAEYLKECGSISVDEVISLFVPICFALNYAHEHGIVHRDIKPTNIVLIKSGQNKSSVVPKIIDFGIAKVLAEQGQSLTSTGEVFGTPLYMSPEQCSGKSVDPRADIYSLGCVMFEALTGQPPFRGNSALETIALHLHGSVLPLKEASLGLEFPLAVEQIVAGMLVKNPTNRYQRCSDVASDLIRFQQGKFKQLESNGGSENLSLDPKTSNSDPISNSFRNILLLSFLVLCSAMVPVLWSVLSPRTTKPEVRSSTSSPQFAGGAFVKPSSVNGVADQDKLLDEERELQKYPIVSVTARETRIDFGPKLKMGYFRQLRSKTMWCLAQGIATWPAGSKMILEIPLPFLRGHPFVLSKFASVGLRGLAVDKLVVQSGTSEYLEAYDGTASGATAGNNDTLPEAALCGIGELKTLETLNLRTINLGGQLAKLGLNKLKSLEYLDLSETNISANELVESDVLSRLKIIRISAIDNVRPVVSAIAKSTRIVTLELAGTKLTDRDLAEIGKLTSLKDLKIDGNPDVGDLGLSYLTPLQHLRAINLAGTSVTDAGLQNLTKLQDLATINLTDCPLSDSGIDCLLDLPKLRKIDLSRKQKTDLDNKLIQKFGERKIAIIAHSGLSD